jgi:iron complex outermembrane receptor protein
MGDHFEIAGRLSRIRSDGYIDRASSSLNSYFLQASYKDTNTLIKGLLFGGHEITYQSWFGVDAMTLAADRTYNPAGEYTDENGDVQFYDNEVDNYKQDHAQLLWNEQVTDHWNTNLAFHFTHGRGYFEQFREDDALETYGIAPATVNGEPVSATDLVRRRWLDNDFYGTVFSATYEEKGFRFIAGGGYNRYEGDHFGEIIWARYPGNSDIRDRYYDDTSNKTDFNIYTKATYKLNMHWSLFGDMQYRVVGYTANGEETGPVDDTFHFFNPKAGLTFNLNPHHSLYLSYARAQREPNRNDYENGSPEPEKLNDFELGWRLFSDDFRINTNIYYMRYKDQLVLTGALNDVGAPLRSNSGDSYRLGLEIDALIPLAGNLQWRPNLALSTNKNIDFYFQRDGVLRNLGNTNIAFSPGLVIGNIIAWEVMEGLRLSLLSKYVGKQYMGNIDADASVLEAYSQTDLNISYELPVNGWLKELVFTGLVNNIFNAKYESNGYFFTYDDDFSSPGTISTIEGAGYYPQAGINFLLGMEAHF